MDNRLKTLQEIQALYSISRWTVYRIMEKNQNRVKDYIGEKVGGQWRFSLIAAEAVAA